jgi:hypothetical protein
VTVSTSRPVRPSIALGLAAVVAWAPALALVIGKISWTGAPARIPIHWTGAGVADKWASSDSAFWLGLVPGVAGASTVTVMVIFVGRDIPRIKGSLGLGVLTAVTGTVSLMWFVGSWAAVVPPESSALPLVLVAAGIAWGILVFLVAAAGRR